jgi:hypothetical protein
LATAPLAASESAVSRRLGTAQAAGVEALESLVEVSETIAPVWALAEHLLGQTPA